MTQTTMYYDETYDMLYLTFADKSASYGDDVSANLTVMRDLDTDELTGAIITEFKQKRGAYGLPPDEAVTSDEGAAIAAGVALALRTCA
jgi:hypothetical protein